MAGKCIGFRESIDVKFNFTISLCLNFYVAFYFVVDDFCYVWGGISCFVERKVLGYIHICRGPNEIGFVGIFQPSRDAIKLFTRERKFPFLFNYLVYYFITIFGYFFLYWFGCWFLIEVL